MDASPRRVCLSHTLRRPTLSCLLSFLSPHPRPGTQYVHSWGLEGRVPAQACLHLACRSISFPPVYPASLRDHGVPRSSCTKQSLGHTPDRVCSLECPLPFSALILGPPSLRGMRVTPASDTWPLTCSAVQGRTRSNFCTNLPVATHGWDSRGPNMGRF